MKLLLCSNTWGNRSNSCSLTTSFSLFSVCTLQLLSTLVTVLSILLLSEHCMASSGGSPIPYSYFMPKLFPHKH